MATRNWWLELEVDGRKAKVETGPRSKDGGFNLIIRQRVHGDSQVALTVEARVTDEGLLQMITFDQHGKPVTRTLAAR